MVQNDKTINAIRSFVINSNIKEAYLKEINNEYKVLVLLQNN